MHVGVRGHPTAISSLPQVCETKGANSGSGLVVEQAFFPTKPSFLPIHVVMLTVIEMHMFAHSKAKNSLLPQHNTGHIEENSFMHSGNNYFTRYLLRWENIFRTVGIW